MQPLILIHKDCYQLIKFVWLILEIVIGCQICLTSTQNLCISHHNIIIFNHVLVLS